MRIAFLINELRHRGAQRVMVDDANAFSRAGWHVLLCTLYRDPGVPSIARDLDPAVEHVVLDARGPFDCGAAVRCARLLDSRRIGTLITTLNDANILGRWVALLSGLQIRLLRRESNTPRRKPLWQRGLDVALDGVTYRILAVADDVRRDLVKMSPWRSSKVLVIHNAARVAPPATLAPGLTPRILTVGRMTTQKDPAGFIGALGIVARQGCAFEAHVVGDGELLGEMQDRARMEGILDRVVFRGVLPHDEVLREHGSADIFVLSSLWEGCPNVVLEAMAHGVPVVATAVGGVPEMVEHGISGILVPPRDTRSLADALVLLTRDAALRRSMGIAARARAARFDPEVRLDRLRHLVAWNGKDQATVPP